MKKIFLGLVAIFTLVSISFAQKFSSEAKANLGSTQMLATVQALRSSYVAGQGYKDFMISIGNPSPTIPQTNELFSKVFEYISRNTSDAEILKANNSTLLTNYALALTQNPEFHAPPYKEGVEDNVASKRKWWQNLINTIVNIFVDIFVPEYNGPEIVIFE